MNFESRNNESPHAESQEILTALLDGQLSAEQSAEVRERLAREPQLRELYAQLEQQRAQLRGLPRVGASSDFASRVAAELRERAIVAELPKPGDESDEPRGGWRSVYLLVGALAAVLLVGVFFWPRSVADNSAIVAQTDSQLRRKELELRQQERDAAMIAAEPLPAAVQRAPSGGRPESRGGTAADGAVVDSVSGLATGAPVNQPGIAEAAGQAAPGAGDLLAKSLDAEMAEGAASPQLSRFGSPADPKMDQPSAAPAEAGKQLADAAPRPEVGITGEAVPGSESLPAANLEVWLVEASESPEPTAGAGGLGAASAPAVEIYLAQVDQPQLPEWMEELRTEAVVTQLDSSESVELLQQLQAKGKLPVSPEANEALARQLSLPAQAAGAEPAKPSESAAAILEDRPGDVVGAKAEEKSAERAAAELNIAYLGLEEPAQIEAVINRSNARQSGAGFSVGGGGGGLEGGEAQRRNASRQQRGGLESNLIQLRSQAANLQAAGGNSAPGAQKLQQQAQAEQRKDASGGPGGGQRAGEQGIGQQGTGQQSADENRAPGPAQAARQIIIIVRPQ